ncbi:MAG: lipoprotein-releasing ABC transporter permease subunit [Candidatus Hydrogenedentota bacterium]
MRFETFVALRYLSGKRKNRFISLISLISVAGVSVGVMALIIVMAVMTGFDNALRETIIGNRAHFTVLDPTSDTMVDYEKVIREIEALCPEVEASSPVVQILALLQNKSGYKEDVGHGANITGVDPELESAVTELSENLTHNNGRQLGRGELPGDKEIVLGFILARNLGVLIGDKVSVLTHKKKVSPFGMRPGQDFVLTVSGISQAKMHEFDSANGWVNLKTASKLNGKKGVDGIHCRIDDPFMAEEYKARIIDQTDYRVVTWYDNQMEFFEALRQEKFGMFIILVFIVLVAAFNITSTLIMMVMEKQRDIGILRTLGVSGGSILRLFMLEGLLIGLGGTFAGVLFGTILAYNLNPVAEFLAGIFGIDLFNSQIYYFDQIPVDVVPMDVLYITIASVILSFFSTLYPAWSASRLRPVDALRYE